MAFPSDLRPFSVLFRIKAITVLKRDKTKVEIRPRLLACRGVVSKWVHNYYSLLVVSRGLQS